MNPTSGMTNTEMRLTPGNVLAKLVASKTITEASASALKVATDPWHDTTINNFSGIPTTHVGKLFVFDDVQEITINKQSSPNALPAGKWSFRVGAFPFAARQSLRTGRIFGTGGSIDNSAPTNVVSNVLVSYAQDGTDFQTVGIGGVGEQNQFLQMSDQFMTAGLTLCGMGIEVIDTTPELYKGGMSTMCNIPQPTNKNKFCETIAVSAGPQANTTYTGNVRIVRGFPKNVSEMVRYCPRQDEAKKGAYLPARMQFEQTPNWAEPTAPVIMDNDFSYTVGGPDLPCYQPVLVTKTVGAGSLNTVATCNNWFNMDSPVVIFSGLPEEGSYTIRVRWFGQIVPDEDGVVFLRAARPAPLS